MFNDQIVDLWLLSELVPLMKAFLSALNPQINALDCIFTLNVNAKQSQYEETYDIIQYRSFTLSIYNPVVALKVLQSPDTHS